MPPKKPKKQPPPSNHNPFYNPQGQGEWYALPLFCNINNFQGKSPKNRRNRHHTAMITSLETHRGKANGTPCPCFAASTTFKTSRRENRRNRHHTAIITPLETHRGKANGTPCPCFVMVACAAMPVPAIRLRCCECAIPGCEGLPASSSAVRRGFAPCFQHRVGLACGLLMSRVKPLAFAQRWPGVSAAAFADRPHGRFFPTANPDRVCRNGRRRLPAGKWGGADPACV